MVEIFFSLKDAAIRVSVRNPLHGDAPYTVTHGGTSCGESGHYIHVSDDYLINVDLKSDEIFGPAGNIFLHEWTKYRFEKLIQKIF